MNRFAHQHKILCSLVLVCALLSMTYYPAEATNGTSFITRYRVQVTIAYNALETLKNLADENTFRAWSSGTLTSGDFVAPNADITLTDLQNAITTSNLLTGSTCLGASGHGTNWSKMLLP